jgi:drug/metabolite transporter (DMT)-like permease
MLGFAIALVSAGSLGATAITVRRGVLTGSPLTGTFLTVLIGMPLFLIAVGIMGQFSRLSGLPWHDLLSLAAIGVFQLVIGRYCFYRSIGCLGANQAELVQALQVPASVVVGLSFLNESMTVAISVALVFIMIGPGLVLVSRASATQVPGSTQTRAKEGILYGLLAVLAFSAGDGLARSVLAGTGLGLAGGMLSYLAAGLVLAPIVILTKQIAAVRQTPKPAIRWFALSSLLTFSAQLSRYLALAIAPVTVVVPLMRTVPVFVLVFSFLVNRHLEVFSLSVVIGILCTVAGTVFLAL